MTAKSAVGNWILRMTLILSAAMVGSLSVVAANESGTPPPNDGGFVVSTGRSESQSVPDDSEVILPTATDVTGEGTPDPDHEALAPGSVTVIIHTSDGNPMAARTMVCVGDICQPADGLASGTKVLFDRVPAGWLGVTVQSDATYETASSSVQVVQGQLSTMDLTLYLIRPVASEQTDTNQSPSGNDHDVSLQSTVVSDAAMNESSVQAHGITHLPSTGTGLDSPSRSPLFLLGVSVGIGLWGAFFGLLALRGRRG